MHPADRADLDSMTRLGALTAERERTVYDASATVRIVYPLTQMCRRCGQRDLRAEEIINGWTWCCRALIVWG